LEQSINKMATRTATITLTGASTISPSAFANKLVAPPSANFNKRIVVTYDVDTKVITNFSLPDGTIVGPSGYADWTSDKSFQPTSSVQAAATIGAGGIQGWLYEIDFKFNAMDNNFENKAADVILANSPPAPLPLLRFRYNNASDFAFVDYAAQFTSVVENAAPAPAPAPEPAPAPAPEPAPAPAPAPAVTEAHIPVTVNFNVEIAGDSNLTVFGEAAPVVTNVIVAETELPVNALYDAVNKKGLIELWEPSTAPDDIYAQLANTDSSAQPGGENLTDAYKVTLRQLAKGLQRLLCNRFDCSAAAPFAEAKYAGIVEYTTQRDFGRVALGCFAHYMFGHVDATSAITNDTQFVKSMLSIDSDAAAISEDAAQGPVDRYAAYKAATVAAIEGDYSAWAAAAGSAADADLARRLVAAVVNKGIANGQLVVSHVSANDAASIANIVRQVVGQDASRLMDEDNAERTKNVHRLLRFYAGDVIYMNIKLNRPSVSVGSGQGILGSTLEANYTSEQNYTLKITLKAAETL
jgi:hypothetical protein